MSKSNVNPLGSTYDEEGRELVFLDGNGTRYDYTYTEGGHRLDYEDGRGYWCTHTYNEHDQELTFADSKGYWCIRTYGEDEESKLLSFKEGGLHTTPTSGPFETEATHRLIIGAANE